MRRFAILIAASLLMISCSQEEDVTGSIHNKCTSDLYSVFNPRAMDQCMAVCLKCDRGTTTTCSTCPFAGYWRPAEADIAGERAALDIEMTALPHDASGITVGDVEGASFRMPSNR
jgi:hypothetical protein